MAPNSRDDYPQLFYRHSPDDLLFQDPEGCPTHMEEFAAVVRSLLPDAELTRTRDCVQLCWGDDEGIVILITPEAIELRLPTVEWACGAYGPRPISQLWRRAEWPEHQ